MANKVIIDPVTRIEGHLKVEVEIENGKVADAKACGTLFRGFELILQGRDPRDAQQITQRICGVCPTGHGTASVLCIDDNLDVQPPKNGRVMRNLIFGANFIQSHILHFYHLAALDYVKGPDIAPFVPRYEGDFRLPEAVNAQAVEHYLQALEMRKIAHEMLAIFGGKMPHVSTIVPGGVTEQVDAQKILSFKSRLDTLTAFIKDVYLPDVYAIAGVYDDYFSIGTGCKNFLAFGGFSLADEADVDGQNQFFKRGRYTKGQYDVIDLSKLTEDVKYSWYNDDTEGKHPLDSVIKPDAAKGDAYSWLKSPRYDGIPHEVGPLARQWVNKNEKITKLGDKAFSVMGRHAARAEETLAIAQAMGQWLMELEPGKPVASPYEMPKTSEGYGLCEAPRGALGHFMRVEKGVIAKYNAVVPTTWNFGPKDDNGIHGPLEQALIGVQIADEKNPVEVVRIIRAFDPCIGCAVHLITPEQDVKKFQVL